MLLFGNRSGTIFIINRNFELTPFQAYEFSIDHMVQVKQHSILITVGVSSFVEWEIWPSCNAPSCDCNRFPPLTLQADEEGIVPVVKVWNTDKVSVAEP